MALVVNTNIAALNAQRNLGVTNSRLAKSLERLASGLRINRSADDAAGLAIATKLNAQVRGLNQAARNSNSAISLLQTAEGGINTVTNILQRLRELAVQSSSDDNTSADRANLASEANNLVSEVTRIVNTSEYNSSRLLDGSFSGQFFQIGANFGQNITFSIADTRGSAIGNIAKQDFDIADGISTAYNANFSTGEFTINSANVAATNATDDQYSVINMSSEQIVNLDWSHIGDRLAVSANSALSTTTAEVDINLQINGVSLSINLEGTSFDSASNSVALNDLAGNFATAASIATDIVSAVNANASLTALNITARVVNTSGYVIERTGGGDINMVASIDLSVVATATYASDITDSASFDLIGLADLVSGTSVVGNGNDMTAATGPTAYNGQSSAISKAAAINSVSNLSGVTATVQANVVATTIITTGSIAAGDVYINGVDLGAVGTVQGSDSDATLATAINAVSTDSGVTAAVDSSTGIMTMTAADGRNITITTKEAADSAILGLGAAHSGTTFIYRAEVRLTDNAAITLAGTLGDLYGSSAGATEKTTAVANTVALDTTQNVAAVDISTRSSAQDAILIIDSALDKVNNTRASLGAVQNRMEFTIANLNIASENMAGAESRIRDADFAMETTSFTRNQIMVQAATAILAQSNTMPQLALQLLS